MILFKQINTPLLTLIALLLGSCTSINNIGTIGPNKLKVISIKDSDFLSANRMLVILDKSGNVAAYSGGSVAGMGTVSMQTAGTALIAGATVAGAKSLQHGLEHAKLTGQHKLNLNYSEKN